MARSMRLRLAVPAIAGRSRPQGHRLQFRSDRAIARRRRQCRGRSDPAARVRRKAAPAAARRRLARLDHRCSSRDFFRMRLMAKNAPACWLDADVLLLKADRDRSGKTLFRLGAAAPARQFGAVSAAGRSDRRGVRSADAAGRTDAGLAVAAASPDVRVAQAARRIEPPLRYPGRDLRSGGADRAGPPRRRIALRAAEEIVLCGACRAETVFRAVGFFRVDPRSRHHRASHLAERPRQQQPDAGKPVCLGGGAVWR